MMIDAKTKLCCIIGNPVEHSLSPQMHNAGFQKLGLNYAFVAFRAIDLKKIIESLKLLNFLGIVVTVPHKIEVMKYVDSIDETAKAIGAVNTIINHNGYLSATNTDWIGAIAALKEKTNISGKKVAVLGVGGAARAIVYGLKKEKATVWVFNRTKKKAIQLAQEFSLDGAYGLKEAARVKNADIIINATSVGMEPYDWNLPQHQSRSAGRCGVLGHHVGYPTVAPLVTDRKPRISVRGGSPLPADFINKKQVVFDIVYTPHETALLKLAKMQEAKVVFGYKMVLYGGAKIFELITSKKAPVSIMENALLRSNRVRP